MPKAGEYGVNDVLDVIINVLKIDGGKQRGDEYDIPCPNPNHHSMKMHTGVNLTTGYWHCFSCGVGGDILDLGAAVTGLDKAAVKKLLVPNSEEAVKIKIKRRLDELQQRHFTKKRKIELPGPYEPGPLSYLRGRGFEQSTLEKWGIRYVQMEKLKGKQNNFYISHSIAIPIRDRKGHLLAWCYRATEDSTPWQQHNAKYIYTPEVEISELWFGTQFHYHADTIVIVEGALDCMWLDQSGIPALGMLGANMGDAKILELQRYSRVILMPDMDDAGAGWVERVGATLGARMPVQVCRYARWMPGRDPQGSWPIDLEIMLARAVPWAVYRTA